MKTIVIYTDGTLGDHLPSIALAQALTARGYRVRMAINQAMHSYAQRAGLEAIALTDIERGPEEARQNAWAWNHWRNAATPPPPSYVSVGPDFFATQAQDLIEICRGADLLLATSIRILGYVVHQALGIPWITISVNPSTFVQPESAEEQATFEQSRIQEFDQYKKLFAYMFPKLGIDKPIPDWWDGVLFARHILLACSPHFSQPYVEQFQPRASLDLTGFWFYQDPDWQNWQPDPELARFCERQPIVLSFSSQPLEERRQTLAKHVQAAARLNRPLLVQRGWADFSEEDLPEGAHRENILFADFIPHDWLFAHAACAIQHGGIGSIARALRQGCPLLIEPYGNDQFYNAHRVTELGVGASLSPFRSTVTDLSQVLNDYVLTPAVRGRAQALGAQLRGEDGVTTACEMIERYLKRFDAQGRLPHIYDTFTPPLTPRRHPAPLETRQAETNLTPVSSEPAEPSPTIVGEHAAPDVTVTVQNAIPKILHQTWKDKNLPADLLAYRQTWQTHHPTWEFRLWTDADNREFIRRQYAWFLPIYDNYPENIMRVDAVRYFILHYYGGVYADLDVECLRALDPLLADRQLLLGLEHPLHAKSPLARSRGLQNIVGNAVMASAPQHPFWEHVFKQLIAFHRAPGPLDATGPFFLTRASGSYAHPEQINVASHQAFYPISNEKPWSELSRDLQTQVAQEAYTIHHWHGNWWRETVAQQSQQAKLTLLMRGETINAMVMSVESYRTLLATHPAMPKISCLMVTQNRLAWAQRSIQCFQQQTYANRELVIIDDGPDDALEQWIDHLDDSRIIYIHLPDENRSLGELRNQAVEKSTGDYVAQWDDDDLSDPLRLELQMAVINALQTDACFLERHQILWLATRRMAISTRRIWEGSFLCAKAILPPYPAQRQGEDTPVVNQIVQRGRVALLDLPQLYTYVFHGENTFAAEHWENHWLTATESFEGPLFDAVLEALQERLHITLPIESTSHRQLTGSARLDAPPIFSQPVQMSPLKTIPKILHQTWKDANLPPALASMRQTWRAHHPDWTHYLWTDEDNRNFLSQHYPWFLPIYDNYPEHIMRVDAIRYFILHHFGGVYVDLDFECIRPLDALLAGKELVFGLEPAEHFPIHFPTVQPLPHIVCNAFMASARRHPFWERMFRYLDAYHRAPDPLNATGPFVLTRACESYPDKASISIESADLLYPITATESQQRILADPAVRERVVQHAYAVHHWFTTWWTESGAVRAEQVSISIQSKGQVIETSSMLQLEQHCERLRNDLNAPRVSCLMLARHQTDMIQRAILCFQKQSYPVKELVIVDNRPEDSLAQWLEQLADDRIIYVRPVDGNKSPAELWAIAVEKANGAYVARWDDDDLSHPRRLEVQLAAIQVFQTEACFLERQQLWWPENRSLALSGRRIWVSSLVCSKESLINSGDSAQYDDDGLYRSAIIEQGKVAVVDFPQLYTCIFHNDNSFKVRQWQEYWQAVTDRYDGNIYSIIVHQIQNDLNLNLPAWLEPPPDTIIPVLTPGSSRVELPAGEQLTTPKILILIPVKDAVHFLPHLWDDLKKLTYPHDKLSIAFLESDSVDGTFAFIEENLPALQAEFARVKLFRRDYGYHSNLPRWEPSAQFMRRSIMAKSRNHLLACALEDEEWVLWVDVDLARWPDNVIEQLLSAQKEIVVPNCLSEQTGETFDYNTFKLKPEAAYIDWSPYVINGILQPPKGYGRFYLTDLRQHYCVEVDGVGGTMLFVRADIHREGLVFPTFSYKLHIETEGLALMARDMGYKCWGLPRLEIFHP